MKRDRKSVDKELGEKILKIYETLAKGEKNNRKERRIKIKRKEKESKDNLFQNGKGKNAPTELFKDF